MKKSYLDKDSSDPSLPMNRPIPRRSQMQQWCSAEKAIYDAMQVVEEMGADPRLTAAVNLLAAAKSQVSDFMEGITRPPLHEDEQGFHYVIDGERRGADLPFQEETKVWLDALTIRTPPLSSNK